MAKKNKLKTKEFSKTFKQCVLQLKKIKEEQSLNYNHNLELSPSKSDSLITTRTLPEMKNAWGQKDLNAILKEKNDRLTFVENELEEKKKAYQRLEQERKKAKFEFEKEKIENDFQKVLQEKDKELSALLLDKDTNKRKISALESQIQSEKNANEILKEASKCLTEISNKKLQVIHKRDYMMNLKNFFENELEISRLQASSSAQEKELESIKLLHNDCKAVIENLNSVILDLENRLKFKSFSKDIEMNDIETVLMDEIDNITNAYDKIKSTNLDLEKNLLLSNSKITELNNENLTLKNRIGYCEDTKSFLEKEKKKLEEWKITLAEETRMFQEKCVETETLISEKDRKITDYKLLLTNLQANHKILEEELNSSNLNYRALKREFEALKSEFLSLKTENESTKKLCELLKGFCSSDSEVLEDLERYKKVIRCSLCDTNVKNCVLIKCSHTFCDGCIENRLKARQRKCPVCQSEFNSNDVKKLYL